MEEVADEIRALQKYVQTAPYNQRLQMHLTHLFKLKNCSSDEDGTIKYTHEYTSSFAIKKSRFDFADELKVWDVRYKHLTQITIKVQLF